MVEQNKYHLAHDFFERGNSFQKQGKLDSAIDCYLASIQIFPTAEAHTLLGLAYSLRGDFERAIEECKFAIELDEEYGNPYNDIGVYLISLRRFEEAMIYLSNAIKAPRYDSRHTSYYHLARINEFIGDWFEAVRLYQKALEINPNFSAAKAGARRLIALMN